MKYLLKGVIWIALILLGLFWGVKLLIGFVWWKIFLFVIISYLSGQGAYTIFRLIDKHYTS